MRTARTIRLVILAVLVMSWMVSCAFGSAPVRRRPLLRRPAAACANGSCALSAAESRRQPVGAIAGTVGGPSSPDGKDEVDCDLPVSQRQRNTGGRDGAGLCVFTSIMHAARYQNEPRLANFQQQMKAERGGGYPEKVDVMIAKYGSGTRYIQYEGSDDKILEAAIKSGRMPSVTYNGRDPHYGNRSIAHMVNLVAFDRASGWAAVLDNNYIGERELVWLPINDFLSRWKGGGSSGWVHILLQPPPPPVPRNF